MMKAALNKIIVIGCLLVVLSLFAGIVSATTYTSQYPTQDVDHVKATTYLSAGYYPYFTTDPARPLTGGMSGNQWVANPPTNQRFHIDLGSSKYIRRIYYENSHTDGGSTDMGVQQFTIWGSNSADAFNELTYATDTGWTEITPSQATFDQHVAANQADPKFTPLDNEVAYQYYAFKFPDNYGNLYYIGVRRIELQTEDGWTPLTANYSANQTSGLYPLAVNFTDTTTGKIPDTYNWSINGNIESTGSYFPRLFNSGGNYTVNLTVTNQTLSSTHSGYVEVWNRTLAAFSANKTSGISPFVVQFIDSSSNTTSWNWSYGDGDLSSLENPVHTYTETGLYIVNLTVNNTHHSDSEVKTDYIAVSIPSFTANITTGVNPLVVMFNDTSGFGITSYNVSFGDGGWWNETAFPSTNLTHLYSTSGNYTVEWHIFVDNESASSTDIITVWGAANSLFSVFNTAGSAPFTTYLYDTSTNLTPGPATYYWDFGDDNTSTEQNLYYTWNITGTYDVKHSVSNGLSTSWKNNTNYVTVGSPETEPVASFYGGPQLGAPPLQVFFTDVSTNTPTGWNWSHGDGTYSVIQNPTHWYNKSGFYTVSLVASNGAGSNSSVQGNYITIY